jgi:hypothetical protein
VPIAALTSVMASVVHAQTSTADGVEAFVRGDYPRAAEILQPIVDDWPLQRDSVADFFMAHLYKNGLGVAPDSTRACALLHRSSPEGPLGATLGMLVTALDRTLTREQFRECEMLMRIGLSHRFQPATFFLGPGHSIAFGFADSTLEYAGKQTSVGGAGDLALEGVVFLPIEHTELLTGAAEPVRRHFIEQFWWAPVGQSREWALTWAVSEVVRDTLRGIAVEEVLRVSARRPPELAPQEIRRLARLRVNDQGVAEWAIVGGDKPRSEPIASIDEWMLAEAQSKEDRERAAAREAAKASIDRTAVRDRYRSPTLTYVDAEGCGHIFVYGWSADQTETMTVRADKAPLQLTTAPQTYDLATGLSGLEVAVQVNERPFGNEPFCTDVGEPRDPEVWRAIGGSVTIELSAPGARVAQPALYRATIRIEGAEFVSATGARVRQVRPITLVALVGGVVG